MDFTQTLKDAGIPTTQEELEVIWKDTVTATGSLISNTDKMSPFWRVVTALITNPVLWLVNFIAVTLIPNAYVKYAIGEFLELLGDAVNLTRKQPTKAVGIVRFTRVDLGLAITVPIETIIQTASINGIIYKLITTDVASFAVGLYTLDVPVIAEFEGSVYNFGANYYSILPTQIAGVTAVANPPDWITLPGTDLETDDDLRGRIRNQFGTASDYHTDSVYKAMISTFPGVHIDAIWFEHNAPRGPGTANAFILFDFSATVTQFLININLYITDQGNHGHGDDLIVYQMPEQNKTLTATVYVEKFLTAAQKTDIHDKAVLFINAAFRENNLYSPTLTLPYNRFSFSRLGEEMHLFIPQIHSVVFSLPDIVTAKWIPRLTSLTVTVLDTE
jgi:uncharacterized phage protein gp47/JayE